MGRTGLEGPFGGFQSTRLNNEEQLRDFRTKSYLCFRKRILENAVEMDKKRGWQSG